MSGAPARRWEAVYFDLDEACFGFVLQDDEGIVHTYERTRAARTELRVPCFSRLEHAQLFAAQWPERPTVARGPSYQLGPLRDAADGTPTDLQAAFYAWTLVLDVLDAADAGDGLDTAETPEALPDREQLRAGLTRFVAALDPLDQLARA